MINFAHNSTYNNFNKHYYKIIINKIEVNLRMHFYNKYYNLKGEIPKCKEL